MIEPSTNPHSSRQRYRRFVQDYKEKRLDGAPGGGEPSLPGPAKPVRDKRRQYLREYLRWLWPYRYGVAGVFFFALLVATLQMAEPLFMRFIIDRVLLNTELDSAGRLSQLHLAGRRF